MTRMNESVAGSERTATVTIRRLIRDASGDTRLHPAQTDQVAVEEPLEIRVDGRSVAVVMRTPGNDRELAAGFLLSEGVISRRADIFELSVCPSVTDGGGRVDVVLVDPSRADVSRLTRHVFTSTSCGICGRTSIGDALTRFPALPPETGPRVDGGMLLDLPDGLRAAQPAFAVTGGLHACAAFDARGGMIALFEDAGRHNALDKLTGSALLAGDRSLQDSILLLSGRASFELIQKALAARIAVVAAVGAPSSLAVEFAEAGGVTLCGFVRNGRCNVYTHAHRIRAAG